jgi:DNA polymerase-3 subunit delta
MDSLTFLERTPKGKPQPLYVLVGDEDFLKRQVLRQLRRWVLAGADEEFVCSVHAGEKATFPDVFDDLQTLPFLGERRLVIVERADPFVTKARPLLEKAVAKLPRTGVLVLDVKSWPKTTKLAKLVDPAATIECKAPTGQRLAPWCVQWMASQYGKQLAGPAAQLLVDLVGGDMGQLDQELDKLSVYVGQQKRVGAEDVDKLVGRSRGENTWKIFDAIAEGKPGVALGIVDRLFDQGEEPLRLLGAFSMQLRRLAQAARLHQQGKPLSTALEMAGVAPFALRGAEQQIRHLGRRRLDKLYDWLLEVDLGVKGNSQLPPRTLIERLVVLLARKQPG